ncbi:WxL protein host-binding domain-containing protein [Fructilactobacillus sp. Tb1]|uniref:WxL protein host-binding domain-containing protein n=1 Tax=Fructilactobacillus sp. Tb1 TaxID=3422304 RepID=UPI003D28BD59
MPNGLKKVMITLLLLVSFTGALIGLQTTGNADQVKSNASLKVEPQTQNLKFQNKASNFFNFNLGGNDQLNQDIVVKVTNTSDKKAKFTTKINQATTSHKGEITYDGRGKLVKNIFDFKQLVTSKDNENKVTLNPGESRDLHFNVQTPTGATFSNFNGTILGGIYILEQPEAKATKHHKVKRTAYPVAIMINKGKSSPNLAMKHVKTDTRYNQNMVDAMVTNNHPDLIGKLDYKATVVKKGTNSVVAQASQSNGQIGPNNQFKLEVPWLTKRITPGAYTMRVKIKSTDPQLGSKGGTWFLEKDFTVSVLDALIVNAKVTHSIPWMLILGLVVILGLLGGLIYWLLQIRKRREGLEK